MRVPSVAKVAHCSTERKTKQYNGNDADNANCMHVASLSANSYLEASLPATSHRTFARKPTASPILEYQG